MRRGVACGSNVEAEDSAAASLIRYVTCWDVPVFFTKLVVTFAKPCLPRGVLLEVVMCANVLFSEMQSRDLYAKASNVLSGLGELGGISTKLYAKWTIV